MRSLAFGLWFWLVVMMTAVSGAQWEPAAYKVRRSYELMEMDEPIHWNTILRLLGLGENGDLKTEDSVKTAQGTTVMRFRERHKEKQIRDSQIDLSLKADGTIDRIGGRVTKDLQDPASTQTIPICHLDMQQAISIAFAHEGLTPEQVMLEKFQIAEGLVIDHGRSYGIVTVDITWTTASAPSLIRKIFTIDACTREVKEVEEHQPQFYSPTNENEVDKTASGVLHREQQMHAADVTEVCENHVAGIGGNEKTKQTIYGIKPLCLEPIRMENGTCFLENEFIKVYNLNHSLNTDMMSMVKFPCLSGVSDTYNGGFSAALDAFYHAIQTVAMYADWYQYKPFEAIQPQVLVHFGKDLDNAFWDGQTLIVGDGGLWTFPYASLDTVAHEMTHGVTEMSSGLIFSGESGAINDAFSDMAGESTEFHFKGSNDWLVGAEVVKADGKAIRYFYDPERDGISISHLRKYEQNMQVHRASGIFNKAFYSVAQILGIRKTFQAFLTANRIYWIERVTFEEAACNVVKAAYDVGLDMEVFQRAFLDVGVTFGSCPDFTEFILPLSINETRNNMVVSMTTQPLFVFHAHPGARHVSISVNGGTNTTVIVTSSFKRDEDFILLQYNSNADFFLNANERTFMRIRSDDVEDQDTLSMTITFSE